MDINQEILECARYGEHEELLMYIEQGADVNTIDHSGNTALHKACANGEIECIEVLLSKGAKRIINNSGNYPEHWAAQNGKTKALELLFNKFTTDIDVLLKNNFGRSVVTEAFESKETDAIAMCLNHSSATEERIIPGNNKSKTNEDGETVIECVDPDADADGNANTKEGEDMTQNTQTVEDNNAVFHDFIFNHFQSEAKVEPEGGAGAGVHTESSSHPKPITTTNATNLSNPSTINIRIRELPIDHADTPFGSDTNPEDDTTGLAIWPASILLSQWVCDEICNKTTGVEVGTDTAAVTTALPNDGDSYTILELGAGVGLPGITAAECLVQNHTKGIGIEIGHNMPNINVYVTDIHQKSIKNSKYNAILNNYKEIQNDNQTESNNNNNLTSYIKDNVNLHIQYMSWNEKNTYPKDKQGNIMQVDLLLGSDLVYEIRILEYLVPTIADVLKPGGRFLYIAPEEGNRQGMQEFITVMQSHTTIRSVNNETLVIDQLKSEQTTAYGIVLKSVRDCPMEFYSNPYPDSNVYDREDQLVLHFYDLAAKKKHILYEFEKVMINIEKEKE